VTLLLEPKIKNIQEVLICSIMSILSCLNALSPDAVERNIRSTNYQVAEMS